MTPRRQDLFFVAALLLGISVGFSAVAQDSQRRLIGAAEADRWRAVGSLRILGRQSCTAVLISATEALTAAHCVVDRVTGRKTPPASYVLVLGQSAVGFAAVRRVTRTAYRPGFVTSASKALFDSLTSDLALLELAEPVSAAEAVPIEIADWTAPVGDLVDIVGYERGGPKSATIREGCMAMGSRDGVTLVTCDVITGLSGSPVLLSDNPQDPPRMVANLSARWDGAAFVVAVAPQIAQLRAQFVQ